MMKANIEAMFAFIILPEDSMSLCALSDAKSYSHLCEFVREGLKPRADDLIPLILKLRIVLSEQLIYGLSHLVSLDWFVASLDSRLQLSYFAWTNPCR